MSYVTSAGDTFQKIASIVYGDPSRETYLKTVNTGLTEPLAQGLTVRTPALKPPPVQVPNGVQQDDVTLSVGGKVFDRWKRISFVDNVDTLTSFAIEADFDPDDQASREIFTPLQFTPVTIFIGKDKVFQGIVVDVSPEHTNQSNTVRLSGYSLPGVLQDCPLPIGQELEFVGQTLQDIATAVTSPFAIQTVFNADPGPAFEPHVAATTSQTVWSFLTRLCQQRSVVMTNDAEGRLVFQNEAVSGLFGRIEQGVPPYSSATSAFQPQQIFSSITAVGPIVIGDQAQSFTVDNPLIGDVFRPDVFEMRDAFGEELEIAAKARAGRMYANAANIEITLEGWRNSNGELWRPNVVISLLAPSINIYNEYKFLVRSVTRTKANDGGLQTALSLTFPGAFSGELPESLPWT